MLKLNSSFISQWKPEVVTVVIISIVTWGNCIGTQIECLRQISGASLLNKSNYYSYYYYRHIIIKRIMDSDVSEVILSSLSTVGETFHTTSRENVPTSHFIEPFEVTSPAISPTQHYSAQAFRSIVLSEINRIYQRDYKSGIKDLITNTQVYPNLQEGPPNDFNGTPFTTNHISISESRPLSIHSPRSEVGRRGRGTVMEDRMKNPKKVFVAGIGQGTVESTIRSHFGQYGHVGYP